MNNQNIRFSIFQLEQIIIALLNNFKNKKFVSNVYKLFNIKSIGYTGDNEKDTRIYVIDKICEIILNKKIENRDILLNYLSVDGRYQNDATIILNELYDKDMSETEFTLIDKKISQTLRYNILTKDAGKLGSMLETFNIQDYDDFDSFIDKFSEQIDTINNELRSAKETSIDQKNDVSAGDSSLLNVIRKMNEKKNSPNAKIKLGIKKLNEMFNGGLESRFYCAIGFPKGWKSGLLLNIALWACQYNTYNTQNGMEPCILYLTQENTVEETLERVWSHYFGNNSDMFIKDNITGEKRSPEEIVQELTNAGFYSNEPGHAELIIKYRSTKTINVNDIKGMIDDLAKENKKVVLVVQDYIKRLKPITPIKDNPRLEYGMISDELAALAKDMDIPVVSAMQFNREGLKERESAISLADQLNSMMKVGASNISESIDIVQNADYCFSVGRAEDTVIDENGQAQVKGKYLTIKMVAGRGKDTGVKEFRHRFIDGNDMRLDEDILCSYSKSLSCMDDVIKETINKNGTKTRGSRSIVG